MSYSVQVVADSIGEHGKRLTTLVATFPRFILSEVNTHRMLSRNSASSRAIPPEQLIARVLSDPFVPETFNARVKGMGVGAPLEDQEAARGAWLAASRSAAHHASTLLEIGVDKSRVNRLLEPFLWHTALISATEWSNFFALRDHPAAQPEFQIIARMMRESMASSTPRELLGGQWHLPFISDAQVMQLGDDERPLYRAHVSSGRCFVVSYDKLDTVMEEDSDVSYQRSVRGAGMGHWSPLEHPAMCLYGPAHPIGNFYGFKQLRKSFSGESDHQKVLDRQEQVAAR